MVLEHRGEYPSIWAAIESIAPKIGCVPQTLNEWVRKHEIETGMRDGVTSAEWERVKALEREVKELRKANEILKLASTFFAQAELDRRFQVLRAFIDAHRDVCGVEPICEVLQIAPSGYWRYAAQQRNPELRRARAKRDDILMPEIQRQRIWQANMQVYSADKAWRQLNREPDHVVRCTVERLMRRMGCKAYNGVKPYAPRFLTHRSHARWTRSIGNSKRNTQISCGSRALPMFRSGKAGCTWPSSLTYLPGVS